MFLFCFDLFCFSCDSPNYIVLTSIRNCHLICLFLFPHLQAQTPQASRTLGPSPPAPSSTPTPAAPMAALNQPPPLLRPTLPAAPALHRQPPPLQQQARFIQPRPTLNQPPPPLIRPANSMPPRLNPRPVLSAVGGQQPPSLIGIQTDSQSSLH